MPRCLLVLAAVAIGCGGSPPKYTLVRAHSFDARLKHPSACGQQCATCAWQREYTRHRDEIMTAAWAPDISRLSELLMPVARDYGQDSAIAQLRKEIGLADGALSGKLLEALDANFQLTQAKVPDARGTVEKNIVGMLTYADTEHAELLKATLEGMHTTDGDHTLPCLLSRDYPVGVAVTPIKPAAADGRSEGANPGVVVNAVPQVVVNSVVLNKPQEKKEEKPDPDVFTPRQPITLSLSTVLNSTSLLDRIEYVSTLIYIYPFPFPPNGDVVLERELWYRFFALQSPRTRTRDLTLASDLHRAVTDMRVRIQDVKTLVIPKDSDLGTVKRTSKDAFEASLTGKGAAHPEVTDIAPTLKYTGEVGTDVSTKLLHQLDQRSTYISPSANFLRITQRGMIGVNLAGRVQEQVTLHVPASHDLIPAVTFRDGRLSVSWLAQPLYSRVDAFTVSVVVARHPTRLRKTTDESFALAFPDTADATFFVGVTRPARITLWQWERKLSAVQESDLLPNPDCGNALVYFRTLGTGGRAAPLRLCGLSPDREDDFVSTLRDLVHRAWAAPRKGSEYDAVTGGGEAYRKLWARRARHGIEFGNEGDPQARIIVGLKPATPDVAEPKAFEAKQFVNEPETKK